MQIFRPAGAAILRAGGRILMYLGSDDSIHLSESALNYFQKVQDENGGPEKTSEFFRPYLVPGLGHCSGGPGTTSIDALPALEAWVEQGVAPDKLAGQHMENGKVVRTRPVCVYPRVASWNGKGSPDDAGNFACATPK
jgi:feruloyl esterase